MATLKSFRRKSLHNLRDLASNLTGVPFEERRPKRVYSNRQRLFRATLACCTEGGSFFRDSCVPRHLVGSSCPRWASDNFLLCDVYWGHCSQFSVRQRKLLKCRCFAGKLSRLAKFAIAVKQSSLQNPKNGKFVNEPRTYT